MDKFWKWIGDEHGLIKENFDEDLSQQMLIGYMIEYLKDSDFPLEFNVTDDDLYQKLENAIFFIEKH